MQRNMGEVVLKTDLSGRRYVSRRRVEIRQDHGQFVCFIGYAMKMII